MGNSEAEAAAKAPKSSTAAQDQPQATSSMPAAPAYPDWSSFQAYSPIPPHGFFPSPVASSSPAPPFMWGPQPMIPPYGTPPHPYVMYPHGVYAHPSIPPGSHPFPYAMASPYGNAEASGAAPSGMEVDGKSSEGKDKSPLKSLKGSLGSLNMITGKNNNDPGKTSGASANGGFSQSGESGSEASSEGSDANSQNDERELKRQRRKQSNRESARRSRLRKQAECEELAQHVEVLKGENASLRAELNQIKKEYDQLLSQNTSLKESLGDTPREAEDLRLYRNVQYSLDDKHKRPLDSEMQAVKNNTAEGGH